MPKDNGTASQHSTPSTSFMCNVSLPPKIEVKSGNLCKEWKQWRQLYGMLMKKLLGFAAKQAVFALPHLLRIGKEALKIRNGLPGYCCGNKNCCMANYHYYEMWWFWLLWALIGALTCCCIYHRHQLQRGSGHHFYFARFFNPGVTKDTSVKHHKLPSYNEVLKMPKLDPPLDTSNAPPPYFDNQESIESASTASAAENCDLEVSNTGHEQIYLPVVSCRLTLLDENPTSKMDHKV